MTRRTVDELIEQLKRDFSLTSIVISHDIPSALLLADHIGFLYQGILLFGAPRRIFESQSMQKFKIFLKLKSEPLGPLLL